MVVETAARQMDEKGIHPEPGFALNAAGRITMFALVFVGDNNREAFWAAFSQAVSETDAVEVVFTSDRYSLPGQGIDTKDWLAIFPRRAKTPADRAEMRFGVMPYDVETKTLQPVDWQHPFWRPQMKAEQVRFCPFFTRVCSTTPETSPA
jgi:hypothetical protein